MKISRVYVVIYLSVSPSSDPWLTLHVYNDTQVLPIVFSSPLYSPFGFSLRGRMSSSFDLWRLPVGAPGPCPSPTPSTHGYRQERVL